MLFLKSINFMEEKAETNKQNILYWEQRIINVNGVLLQKVHDWILPLYIQWRVSSLVQYILGYTILFTATFSYVLGALYITLWR